MEREKKERKTEEEQVDYRLNSPYHGIFSERIKREDKAMGKEREKDKKRKSCREKEKDTAIRTLLHNVFARLLLPSLLFPVLFSRSLGHSFPMSLSFLSPVILVSGRERHEFTGYLFVSEVNRWPRCPKKEEEKWILVTVWPQESIRQTPLSLFSSSFSRSLGLRTYITKMMEREKKRFYKNYLCIGEPLTAVSLFLSLARLFHLFGRAVNYDLSKVKEVSLSSWL